MQVRHLAATLIAVCVFSVPVFAQTPTVVANLPQPTTLGANATQFTAIGDAIYFYSRPYYYPGAIWKWTEADGLRQMLLIEEDGSVAYAPQLMAFGDKLLFTARTGGLAANGYEIWISNGTAGGTTVLKDIHPVGGSFPRLEVVANGKAYFTAEHPDLGRELWVTDGTPVGTTLVKDLTNDVSSSFPQAFAARDGLAYFVALNQLWVTDGTAAGTSSLASNVHVSRAGVLDDRVVFLGADETNGRELWSTDGTVAGTTLLKDIEPGAGSSWGGLGTTFVRVGATLYFIAETVANGRELWRTDGTAGGTVLVKDIVPGEQSTTIEQLVASDAGVFFVVNGKELWFSDGTEAGTIELAEYGSVTSLAGAPNGAYLTTLTSTTRSLVYSDGTVDGTAAIPNVDPQPGVTSTAGKILFNAAAEGSSSQPWITDGTEAGTHLLAIVPTTVTAAPLWMRGAGNHLFMPVGRTLYRSDGTGAGTIPLKSFQSLSNVNGTTGNRLLFGATQNDAFGLWSSDGSAAGTVLVKPMYSIASIYTTAAGYALVVAYDAPSTPATIWRTDGTEAGTQLVSLIGTAEFKEIAGNVYFLDMYDPQLANQRRLWVTRGTPETTRIVAANSNERVAAAGGTLFLARPAQNLGVELWKSDGSAEGFALVKDIDAGTGSSNPDLMKAAGNTLVFFAWTPAHGRELWRSDGTEAGTYLLREFRSGTTSTNVLWMVEAGRWVYIAVQGDSRHQLWRTDGTIAGTMQLNEVLSLHNGIAVDGTAVFNARTTAHGSELWDSDGTAAGTFLAADLAPGVESSHPSPMALTTSALFFSTADGRLWTRARTASRFTIADARITEGDAGTAILQFTVTREGSTSGAASVSYATSNGTATAGADYESASGTLSFADGEAFKQIAITILGDDVIEANETLGVTLSGATGATIIRPYAAGLIDEDDRSVALSIEYVPRQNNWDRMRTFRIRNDGPSLANVKLRVSESPYEAVFTCDGKNPAVCTVGPIAAGQSLQFTVQRTGYSESAVAGTYEPPGRTLTATVSAEEAESDLTDNTVVRMITADASVTLPPYLVAGTTAQAWVTASTSPDSATVGLALSGGVIVSPSSRTITAAQPVATFDLTVAPNAWGPSLMVRSVNGSSSSSTIVPIVLPGEPVKLATTLVRPFSSYGGLSFPIGDAVTLPVTVAAVLHDGTRPSGTIKLVKRSDSSVVQTRTLDGDGKATFTLNDLAAGTYAWDVVYEGDDHFAGLRVGLENVRVVGRTTSTVISVEQNPCGATRLVVTVIDPEGQTPTGTVDIGFGGPVVYPNVPLVASATAGQATATVHHVFTDTWYQSITATYKPTGDFAASNDWHSFYPAVCPAPALIASAVSTTSVSLLWSEVGAHSYEIVRAEAPAMTIFTVLGTVSGTSYTDTQAMPGRSYLYKVKAKNAAGDVRSMSSADIATTILFSDDPIVFRTSRIKAAHVNELRLAVNAVRALRGDAALTFTPITAGMPVKASDLVDLRNALGSALSLVDKPVSSWTEGLETGKPVKVMHIQQMRNVVK